jgi:hypothetical protein
MITPLAVSFYGVVVFLHVTAVVAAFGLIFAYPLILSRATRRTPEAVPGLAGALRWAGRFVVTPAAVVALLSGAYLATDADAWSEPWVSAPAGILIVLLGLLGAVVAPAERRLAALAARDVEEDRAAGRPLTFSEEYLGVYRRLVVVTALMTALVVIALWFMIVKPFA